MGIGGIADSAVNLGAPCNKKAVKIDLQRKIDRYVGTLICGVLSLMPHAERNVGVEKTPSKILVVLLSEMGSIVLAEPMFEHIRQRYPHAVMHILTFERNREIIEILNLIPNENILTVNGESLSELIVDSVKALIRMRHIKIDTAIDCELFSRIGSIYSFLSGARIRVGFHRHNQEGLYRGSFINRPVLYNPYHHISQQFINLAVAIEANETPRVKRILESENHGILSISFSEHLINGLRQRFETDFPQICGTELILLYPGGGLLPIRAWPLENYCRIADDLIAHEYSVGIIGMKADRNIAATILSHCHSDRCVDLTGYTKTLKELMILFHFSSLLITNDGGPGHFASLIPIPAIVLFGPETPTLYGSLSPSAINMYRPISCSPCLTAYNHRNSPCDGNNVCLKAVKPEMVLNRAYQILNFKGSKKN